MISHLGLILDGNRRFAKSLNLSKKLGHKKGYEKIKDLITWCNEADIKELTLYVFSMQNFNRPKEEFDYLMDLARVAIKEYGENEEDIRINFLGRLDLFPEDIKKNAKELENKTKNNKFKLNLAFGYGGREEIIDAVNKVLKKGLKKISEEEFEKYLYTKSEPELIIRTGGEIRTSNFLAWQSIYSEWIFTKTTWPEFTKKDFLNALNEYSKREIRRGK